MSRDKHQLNLPATEVQNLSREGTSRKKVSGDSDLTPERADVLVSELFDEALTDARITSTFVSLHLGVSESLVSRWRSTNYKEQPSLSQMLRLPFTFQLELHKAMNRRFGFGRAALRELMDVVGLIAVGQ